jgi:hypothetical protein
MTIKKPEKISITLKKKFTWGLKNPVIQKQFGLPLNNQV